MHVINEENRWCIHRGPSVSVVGRHQRASAEPVNGRTVAQVSHVTFPFPDPVRIAFAGDWHGNAACAGVAIEAASRHQAEVLVQLGDFGIWPGLAGEGYLAEVSRQAELAGMHLLVVDGNHEDFDRLESLPLDPDTGLRELAPHLWHLPRGSRWQWANLRFGALGGATSLDRPNRTPNRSWWPQEEITEDQAARMAESGELDILLTHDCPSGVQIPGIYHRDPNGARNWPMVELYRAWDHRDRLAEVCRTLRPTHLWHGHYHIQYVTTVPVFGPLSRVRGLADDNSPVSSNMEIVTLADLAADVAARRRDVVLPLPVTDLDQLS